MIGAFNIIGYCFTFIRGDFIIIRAFNIIRGDNVQSTACILFKALRIMFKALRIMFKALRIMFKALRIMFKAMPIMFKARRITLKSLRAKVKTLCMLKSPRVKVKQ